jgi:Glycosyltransferases, probably involved in cell wall biogenesis
MTVSLIISTYNRPEALAKVLAGVSRQTHLPGEILIADDGSAQPTRSLIEKWKNQLPVAVHHIWHADAGFRKTIILNKAINAAQADYVVFLDGDCVPHAKFIADHEVLAQKGFWVQGRRSFVKSNYVAEFDPAATSIWQWLLLGRMSGAFKAIRLPSPIVRRGTEQRGLIGCNMGIWREDLVAVNGFDETYIGWGGEDSDIGSRLYHLGRPRKFVYGHAIVYHLDHPTLSRDSYGDNRARLQETLRLKRVRCERGLAQHA